MAEIIPAILTDSPAKFKEMIRKIEPYTSRVHIDIADGVFVPNKTVKGYEELKDVEAALKFDVHLMVVKPQEHLKEWFYSHAERFIIHAESEVDLDKIIATLHEHKRKVGLALNPETSFNSIENYISKIDFVQFMTVHPGFQGGIFVNEVVDKIAAFHKENPDIIIMSDGGVTPETISSLVKAGVSILISGSYIFKSQDVKTAMEELKKSCTT